MMGKCSTNLAPQTKGFLHVVNFDNELENFHSRCFKTSVSNYPSTDLKAGPIPLYSQGHRVEDKTIDF